MTEDHSPQGRLVAMALRDRREADFESRIEQMLKAREAIETAIGPQRKGEGAVGEIDCPICARDKLRFVRMPNGHIRARCQSGKCVSWRE